MRNRRVSPRKRPNSSYFWFRMIVPPHLRGVVGKPGTTIVCGDSHTSAYGDYGALALGIGTSDVEHVLATQTGRPHLSPVPCHGRRGSGDGTAHRCAGLGLAIGGFVGAQPVLAECAAGC
jgi:hypothetical protein